MTRVPVSLAAILVALGIVSCQANDSQDNNRITFSVNDFRDDGDCFSETRSNLVNGTSFIWSECDTVGIYPNTGGQVYFAMTAGAGTNSATFDGGGWNFKSSAIYYSYYPFIGRMYLDRHHIPVSYLGQHQPTATSTDHIGPYDYMCTPATSAENGSLLFSYSHLNSLIRVTASLPAGTFTKMTITSPDEDFATKGYFDLAAVEPTIISTETSNQLSITLGDITSDGSSSVIIYMMSAPVDLTGKQIIVRFYTSSGTIYYQTKNPSYTYNAGTIGGLTCADLVRDGDISDGVGLEEQSLGDDDEVLTINQ